MTWRYCATIRLLPTHCRIDGYRSCGGREVSPGKNVGRRAIVSPLREPTNGYWASLLRASSPLGLPPTALHVCSRPHFTSDFLRTSPHDDALVFSVGFPPLGSPEDLHLLFYAHAGRTLRRLLACESRLRRPERRGCLLTLPTSLEMSPWVS